MRSKQPSRVKRQPRDPSSERKRSATSKGPIDELYEHSDGAVDREMEFDTDRYDMPNALRD